MTRDQQDKASAGQYAAKSDLLSETNGNGNINAKVSVVVQWVNALLYLTKVVGSIPIAGDENSSIVLNFLSF